MDTPNDTMTKLASLERGSANVNRLIVSHLRAYAELEEALHDFVTTPDENSALKVDEALNQCEAGLQQVRQSISKIAVLLIDQDENNEDDEVTGTSEEDGIRLM